jgi:protein-disulfide isomerase
MMVRVMLLALVGCGERNESLAAKPGTPPTPAAATTEGDRPAVPPAPAPRAAELPAVVAEVGGQPVTWDEVFQSSASDLIEAEIALDEARRNALESLIMQRLVEAEAQKQNTTAEALIQAEVAKLPPPSDAEVSAFYEKNKAQMPGPLEQVKPQLVNYLQQQQAGEVIKTLVARLKSENAVKVMLPAYRVSVDAASGPRKGPASAPVQIVEFSDFQCPYCSAGAATIEQVVAKYGDKVSIAFRHFPLPMHPQAERAAQASMCANDQGGFWKFHDALFADRKAWTDDDFRDYAKKAKLDGKKFGDCLQKGQHADLVKRDMEAGEAVGMNGTPGFYINGIVLTGARPLEDFVQIIDAELARVNAQ